MASMVAAQATSNIHVLQGLSRLEAARAGDLPDFCATCRRRNERRTACRQVAEVLRRIIAGQQEKFPFVCCCFAGAKLLVTPMGDDASVAFCRSPYADENLLKLLAARYGNFFSTVVKNWCFQRLLQGWERLPKFGLDFAKAVIDRVEKDTGVSISDDMKRRVENLGGAYGDYEVDQVAYNTLRVVASNQGTPAGTIIVRYASVHKGTTVVRCIVQHFNAKGTSGVLPIVGFAVEEGCSGDLQGCLTTDTVNKVVSAVLPDPLPGSCWRFAISGDGSWTAQSDWHAHHEPEPGWKEWAEGTMRAGFHIGSRTAVQFLRQRLDKGGLRGFGGDLRFFANRYTYPTVRGGRETLLCRVIRDLEKAIQEMSAELPPGSEEVRKSAISGILAIPERYSLLTAAPPGNRTRARSLREDLAGIGGEYAHAMEVAAKLEAGKYEERVVRDCLTSYPVATLRSLLDATIAEDIRLHTEPGHSAWRTVFSYCWQHGRKEDLEGIAEELFEVAGPLLWKGFLAVGVDAFAVLCVVMTLGLVPVAPLIRRIHSRVRSKYFERRFALGARSPLR